MEHGTVRFTHPLLASVLYQGLPAVERQRAHRRLADLVEDPVARARHLALSTDQTDADLADALEQAAEAAQIQGAPIVAAELGEHALRLTPSENRADADRRASQAARTHLAAGEVERARALASDLVARASAGTERAEALALLGEIESEEPRRAIPLLNEALLDAGAESALAASIHQRLSLIVRFTEGIAAAERHAEAAVEVAERLDDAALRAAAMAGLALIRFNAGKPGALRLAEQASALVPAADASSRGRRRLLARPHSGLVVPPRAGAASCWRASTGSGANPTNAWPHTRSGTSRTSSFARAISRWPATTRSRPRNLSGQYARAEAESPTSYLPLALVAAHRGDLELAREYAERDLQAGRDARDAALRARRRCWGSSISGVESQKRPSRASRPRSGSRRPAPATGSIRACAGGGQTRSRRCSTSASSTTPSAGSTPGRRTGNDFVANGCIAHATRCRGLVAASRGDVDEAMSLLADAVIAPRGGRRSLRRGTRASRPRCRSPAGAPEARGPRGDRRSARPLRGDGSCALGGESARGARSDRRSHA